MKFSHGRHRFHYRHKNNKINLRNLCEERVGKWLPLGISGNTKTLEAIGGDKKSCSNPPPPPPPSLDYGPFNLHVRTGLKTPHTTSFCPFSDNYVNTNRARPPPAPFSPHSARVRPAKSELFIECSLKVCMHKQTPLNLQTLTTG